MWSNVVFLGKRVNSCFSRLDLRRLKARSVPYSLFLRYSCQSYLAFVQLKNAAVVGGCVVCSTV